MVVRKAAGALTLEESRIVKALLARGWRNQDIQALININRNATINSARITEVKGRQQTKPASEEATDFYIKKKASFDPQTGLNLYDDERLIRSREAMLLAVQVFNNPGMKFKTEVFAVQANIAWTYLLHEHFLSKGVKIEDNQGRTLLLSQMIQRNDFPLSKGIKNNLADMIDIRNDVEHKLLRRADYKFFPKFQACCLNFDKALCTLFDNKLSLKHELSLALQFAKLDFDQIECLQKYDIPDHISALDARLDDRLSDEEKADIEYQFRVVYMLESTSKGKAHIRFIKPGSEEGAEIHNVLEKHVIADKFYPFKPREISSVVSEKSGKRFTSHNHTQAMYLFSARPRSNSRQPENTNKTWCIYHPAYKSYTYSQSWVDHLVEQWLDVQKHSMIKTYKPR